MQIMAEQTGSRHRYNSWNKQQSSVFQRFEPITENGNKKVGRQNCQKQAGKGCANHRNKGISQRYISLKNRIFAPEDSYMGNGAKAIGKYPNGIGNEQCIGINTRRGRCSQPISEAVEAKPVA